MKENTRRGFFATSMAILGLPSLHLFLLVLYQLICDQGQHEDRDRWKLSSDNFHRVSRGA